MFEKIILVLCIVAAISVLVACTSNNDDVNCTDNENVYETLIPELTYESAAEPIFQDDEIEVDMLPSATGWCDCGVSFVAEVIQAEPPLNILPFGHRFFDHDYDNICFMHEFIGSFEYLHEVTFHHWDGGSNHPTVIWTDTIVRDLSLVELGMNNTDIGMQPYFVARETLITIDELLPGDAIIANLLFSHYLMPSVGLIFTDENGVQRRMFIADDLGRSAPCFCFTRFVLVPDDEIPWWAVFKYYEWY